MGYITIISIDNSSLNAISADTGFGKRLAEAIRKTNSGQTTNVTASGNGQLIENAARVLVLHHSQVETLIASGGPSKRGRVVTREYAETLLSSTS
jgi:hypothetical protein